MFALDPRYADRVQRVSGVVSRADLMRAVEPGAPLGGRCRGRDDDLIADLIAQVVQQVHTARG